MRDWLRLGWLLAVLSPLCAAPPEITFEAGFDRKVIADEAVPIRLRVTAVDGPAKGMIELPLRPNEAGQPREINRLEVDVPAGGSKTYWMVVWPGDYTSELAFIYRENGRGRRQYTTTVKPIGERTRLIAVVDPTRSGLGFLRFTPETSSETPSYETPPKPEPYGREVANLTVEELPPLSSGYTVLTSLVLTGSEVTSAPREVREAIADWVRHGGHLVMVGGAASAGLWQDEVIAALSPVRVSGLTDVSRDQLEPLRDAYDGRFEDQGDRFAISDATVLDGDVKLSVGGHPFLVEGDVGLGRVTFLAADFAAPPLQGWTGQEDLWLDLLEPEPEDWPEPGPAAAAALRNIAAVLPSVQTPALVVVAGFLLLYLIILIPVQFPLLKKLDRRELAWLTTPLIVLVFSVGAFFLGLGLKGRDLVLSSTALVETLAGREAAVSHGVTAVYSPAKDAYRIEFPPGTAWLQEMPDTVREYNYYYEEPEEANSRLTVLQTPTGPVLDDLPINMWAMRIFSYRAAVELGGTVEVRAVRQGDSVRVTVTNKLPLPLESAVLAIDGSMVPVGTVQPGEEKEASKALGEAPPPPADPEPVYYDRDPGQSDLAEYLGRFKPKGFEPELLQSSLDGLLGLAPDWSHYGEPEPVEVEGAALWGWVEGAPGIARVAGRGARQQQLWLLRVAVTPEGDAPR